MVLLQLSQRVWHGICVVSRPVHGHVTIECTFRFERLIVVYTAKLFNVFLRDIKKKIELNETLVLMKHTVRVKQLSSLTCLGLFNLETNSCLVHLAQGQWCMQIVKCVCPVQFFYVPCET